MSSTTLMTSDGPGLDAYTAGPQWGIFDDSGNPVVEPDSILGFEYRVDFRVSDYPVEDGGFGSYDKVSLPYGVKIAMTKGGSDSDRSDFLNAVQAALVSLNLYTVVTPEISYANANIVHYDYARQSRAGATLLLVDVWLEEIRVTGTAQTSNTAAPSGADPVQGGTVSPQAPTSAQSSAVTPTPTADSPHDTPTPAAATVST